MKKNSFIEGAFIATIAILISKILGILYVIPFYEIVGTKGGALYGYAYNIYNLFLIISSAGIPLAISKLTSEYNALNKNKEKEYMYYITKKIILIFSVVSFLICFIFAKQIAFLIIGNISGGNTINDISFVIRCVSFALLVVPMLSINRGYLQGHGYISPASISQVIEQIVRIIVILAGSFLALKVFNLSLKDAVGVAVFGAFIGALSAYFYLMKKYYIIKPKEVSLEEDKEKRKIIVKKIITYSIPFIVISISNSLYNTIDMILLIKGLNYLGYNINDIETISSIFTTWGHKLNSIITSIATGVAISLIPALAKSNVKKNTKDINDKFNKILQIFLYVAFPLAIFMSIFSKQVWNIFYGESVYGPIVFKFLVITAAVDALYIMICNGLQGLNKTKLIYVSVITGLLLNLSLDIPLIILFDKLHIYPFYGAISATIIGYSVSLIVPLKTLKNKYNLEYSETYKIMPKLFLSYIILIFISIIYRVIINNIVSRLLILIALAIYGIIVLILYILINKTELESLFEINFKKIINKMKGKIK